MNEALYAQMMFRIGHAIAQRMLARRAQGQRCSFDEYKALCHEMAEGIAGTYRYTLNDEDRAGIDLYADQTMKLFTDVVTNARPSAN